MIAIEDQKITYLYTEQMDAAVLGDKLPEVTQKPFLDPGSLLAVPAVRELASACRVSIFSGIFGGRQIEGVSSSLRPKLSRPFARYRLPSFYSRQISLGNCMCFVCTKEKC